MTREQELKMLKEQKKKIDERIKELNNQVVNVERCRFWFNHFAGARDDEWTVSYKTMHPQCENEERYRVLIASPDRTECIKGISTMITDLQLLINKLEEEGYVE